MREWRGAARPERVVLEGAYARLEPLNVARHARALFASAREEGAEERHRYLMDDVPRDEASYGEWVERAAGGEDPLVFAVVDRATGRAEGRQALMRVEARHGVIEIGGILWGPAIARTRVTTEAVYLMGEYVFERLGYRRLEWKCDSRNAASRRAAERFGFQFEGIFRQHMVVKGENRDTAWFAMVDGEWPRVKAGFVRWLEAGNFDAAGRQVRRLEECRG